MLDINLIRHKPDWVKQKLSTRTDPAIIDDLLVVDEERRDLIQQVEDLRRERNVASKAIGRMVGAARKAEKRLQQAQPAQRDELQAAFARLEAEAEAAKDRPRQINEQISELENSLRTVEERYRELQLWIPNLPHDAAPPGPDESFNKFHEPQGAPRPQFEFEPLPHWDLGTALDIIDFERGVKLSGSRFYILKGWGARLQRALIQFMLDVHINRHGYTEIYPPFMVHSNIFEGAAHLPKFFDNIYRDAEEDFMLLATAEIALTGMHRDEILEEADLPLKYVAYTPCFRREKMSAGKDVRGIKRVHQFDKVEMYRYVKPEESYQHLEELKQDAIDICDLLGFQYRIVELASGDIGFGMARTYDIEIWASGCQEWLEVSSISNAEDFQARRSNIRFRPTEDRKLRYPHTLNASGLALPRVLIGLLENNQQADGSILIPEALQPYLNNVERIPAV